MPVRLCIKFQHSFLRVTEATFSTWWYWHIPVRDVLWTHWFIRLLPQDPGPDRAQRTSPEAAALSLSPAGDGLDSQADLQSLCPPLRPLVLPALPLLSLPYTGHSSPERSTVTGMLMSSSLRHSFCWWGSLSCPSLSKDTPAVTAAGSLNLLRNHRGSGRAVRAHQLINRAGVVYSRLILPGTGSERSLEKGKGEGRGGAQIQPAGQ